MGCIYKREGGVEKYWVTQSGYFRLSTAVELDMGITYGKVLFCHGVSERNVDKKMQREIIKTGRFMAASIIPLQLILVTQI